MRIWKITIATALLGLSLAASAQATTFSGAGGLLVAIPDTKLTDAVHCRPWVHPHRWGWGRGCFYRRAFVGPRFYHPRRFHAGPRFFVGSRFHARRFRHW